MKRISTGLLYAFAPAMILLLAAGVPVAAPFTFQKCV